MVFDMRGGDGGNFYAQPPADAEQSTDIFRVRISLNFNQFKNLPERTEYEQKHWIFRPTN